MSGGHKGEAAAIQAATAECLVEATNGKSYITWTVPLVEGAGVANYMAKYLSKWDSGDSPTSAGFRRRWSCSKGWPRAGRLRLAGTDSPGWDTVHFEPGGIAAGPAKELEQARDGNKFAVVVGDDLALLLGERVRRKVFLGTVDRLYGRVKSAD